MIPGLRLRSETDADANFLFALYASTRAEEMAATGWDAAACHVFLQLQHRCQQAGYRSTYSQAQFSVILRDNQAIGRLVIQRDPGEIRLVDIALLPAFRNRGIGFSLLQSLLAEGSASQLPVRLRVLQNNPARRLYERLGFRPTEETAVDTQMECRPTTAPGTAV